MSITISSDSAGFTYLYLSDFSADLNLFVSKESKLPILVFTKFDDLGSSVLPNGFYYNTKTTISSDSGQFILSISYNYFKSYSTSKYYFVSFINTDKNEIIKLDLELKKGSDGSGTSQDSKKDTDVIYTLLIVTGGGISLWIFLICVKTICMKPRHPPPINRLQVQTNIVGETEYQELIDKAMPCLPYSQVDSTKYTKATNCAVCLIDFETEEICRQSICGHIFHKECIEEWLKRHKNCPFCRANFEAEDIKKFILTMGTHTITSHRIISQADEIIGLIDSAGRRLSARIENRMAQISNESVNAGENSIGNLSDINLELVNLSFKSLPIVNRDLKSSITKNKKKRGETLFIVHPITHRIERKSNLDFENSNMISMREIGPGLEKSIEIFSNKSMEKPVFIETENIIKFDDNSINEEEKKGNKSAEIQESHLNKSLEIQKKPLKPRKNWNVQIATLRGGKADTENNSMRVNFSSVQPYQPTNRNVNLQENLEKSRENLENSLELLNEKEKNKNGIENMNFDHIISERSILRRTKSKEGYFASEEYVGINLHSPRSH